jgi:hypothetical protein
MSSSNVAVIFGFITSQSSKASITAIAVEVGTGGDPDIYLLL